MRLEDTRTLILNRLGNNGRLCTFHLGMSDFKRERTLMMQILKKTVVADKTVAHACQIICAVVSGLVLVFGIRRLADADLTGSELNSALTGTLFLTGVFIVIGFQCRAWRRAA